jgi:hypothetical protein
MTAITWRDFARAALGSWPNAGWDSDTVAAYVSEIEARGIEPAEALRAVRESEARWPLSVGEVLRAVRAQRLQARQLARRAALLADIEARFGVPGPRAVPELAAGDTVAPVPDREA